MKIVIVDDESLIRMDLRDQLEQAGHEVLGEGCNGVEAIALAKSLQPDIVLMDVKMPELNGIEAARQIRRARYAPVVLLTAYSQADLVEKAQASGVYGYLIKPVREEQLVPTLKMALSRFRDEEKLLAETQKLERSLDGRKNLDRAKGILMELYHISEEEAYSRIRRYSMDKGKTIDSIALAIVKESLKKKN